MRNRLRVLRAEHHLSQVQLADYLGTARQTVHAIETGKFAPSLTLAFKIATLFGADINDVFAPDPQDTLPSLLENPNVVALASNHSNDRSVQPRALVFFGKQRADRDRH